MQTHRALERQVLSRPERKSQKNEPRRCSALRVSMLPCWPRAVTVPLAHVDRNSHNFAFPNYFNVWRALQLCLRSAAGRWTEWLAPFRTVNNYGLFAVMTTERHEIIVEGSNDGVNWLPYEFKYKPGDVNRRPAFCRSRSSHASTGRCGSLRWAVTNKIRGSKTFACGCCKVRRKFWHCWPRKIRSPTSRRVTFAPSSTIIISPILPNVA